MFGNNEIVKQDLGDGQTLYVKSIFKTVQGEGPLAGTPAIFVRLAGCNLRCKFCDTDFEREDVPPQPLAQTLWEIHDTKKDSGVNLIVITGGEPLLQNIMPLIMELLKNNMRVQIETAGTVWIDELEPYMGMAAHLVTVVVSPKTKKVHPKIFELVRGWKYIHRHKYASVADGLPTYNANVAPSAGEEQGYLVARPPRNAQVYLQPCDEGAGQEQRANRDSAILICQRFGYQLSIQQHKIIGVE